jgi:hypothetical protein
MRYIQSTSSKHTSVFTELSSLRIGTIYDLIPPKRRNVLKRRTGKILWGGDS